MDSTPAPENRSRKPSLEENRPSRDSHGIALFMVIAALSVLSIVVTEFTYVAQVNQKLAFDGLDQLKAHYLAKTGLKISLLRLKAYMAIKAYANNMVKAAGGGAAAQSMVPKSLLDKVWSFPFFYPFPTNIPGLSPAEQARFTEFNKASTLDGKFSAIIESESSKFNLNSILAGYVVMPSPSPSPTQPPGPPGSPPRPNPPNTQPTPNPTTTFNPEAARDQLRTYLKQILDPKMEEDQDFADAYRDPHMLEDLMDNIAAWADFSYQQRQNTDVTMKRAPFYAVSELHMIPGMDDDLYNLFAPNLTVARTPGVNVNTIKDVTLKAFFPGATKEEIEKFFKDRDSEETDGSFKAEDDFYKYIQGNFQAYNRGTALDELRKQFTANNVRFVTDETEFKITVQAQRNQSTRLIEAWVSLGTNSPSPSASSTPPPQGGIVNLSGNGSGNGAANSAPPDPGVRIHFMRIL